MAARQRHPRRGAPPPAAAASSSAAAFPPPAGGTAAWAGGTGVNGRTTVADVIDWTINLPWQKAFSWFVVAVVASQLHDFFGVSALWVGCGLLDVHSSSAVCTA